MAVYDQMITSYSDTTPHIRVISDVINMIDPVDTPLLDYLGGLDAARSKFKIKQNGYKIEILEDEYAPLAGAASGATGLTSDTTLTNWTVADASVFQDGHVVQMDDEYVVIKAADVTNNTVTVYSRSYGGTNATHATNETMTIVGMARLEGDDADYGPIVDITAPYNYTSIFQEALKVSGTQQVIDQYGISNEFAYEANKIVPSKLRLVNRMAFHGIRAAGSATAPRSAGGLGTFVTGNSVNAGGAIAKADVDTLMEYIYADGGNPDVLVLNHAVAGDLKGLIDSSSFVRLDQENAKIGMNPITQFTTQYGNIRILMDRHCPVAKGYILDSSKVGFYQLRPFGMKSLAVTGDSVKGEVVGEFSFLVANDSAHGYIYGITS